jgi:hypothetical protein
LDGVWGLIACFTTMEPILNGHFRNLNRYLDVAGVGEWVGLVGKNLTWRVFCLSFSRFARRARGTCQRVGIIKVQIDPPSWPVRLLLTGQSQ